MHEIVFAKTVLKELESVLDRTKEVEEVIIEVGELVGIHDHDLKHALMKLSPYRYTIVTKNSLISSSCGYNGPAKIIEKLHDKVIFSCPQCEEPEESIIISEGNKIIIKKIVYK